MKTLKKFEFPAARAGVGQSQYDWGKLLDGGIYQLEEGKDYTSNVKTVGMLARKQARKIGKKVKLAEPAEGQPAGLILQAYDATAEEVAAWAAKDAAKKAAKAAGGADETEGEGDITE